MSDEVAITVSIEQARAIIAALDIYSRLGLGQLQVISEMIARGEIPAYDSESGGGKVAPAGVASQAALQVKSVKALLGYGHGASLGLGAKGVPLRSMRSYEVMKVLAKAVAEHAEPSPAFRGVDYDGLMLRYTQDPAPTASVK